LLKENTLPRHVTIGPVDELAQGERKLVFVDGQTIVVFNIEGTIRAIDNSCPHHGASLANGRLDGRTLRCPAHGLSFDLTTNCTKADGLCLKSFSVRAIGRDLVLVVDK
jgi:3-phenylpropionate/trans-cinnamate dioxygenase ferredoxin subunit